MSIKEVLFLIVSLQTLVSGVLLLVYKSPKRHVNTYLGLFFIFLFLEISGIYLQRIINDYCAYYFPLRFNFLTIVFLYLYAARTTGIEIHKKYLYFVPAILEFLVFSILTFLVLHDQSIHEFLTDSYFFTIYRSISSIYMIVYSFLTIRINFKHKRLLPIFFSDVKFKSLNWLTIFCLGCISLHVLRHVYHTFGIQSSYISIAYCFIALFFLYYATIGSLVQININNVINSQKAVLDNKEELEEVFATIDKHLRERKSYLTPELNLKKLANETNLSERVISKAINKILGKNFSVFINHYRIEEFKYLLSQDKYKNYSISALADEVGFSSRTSFYKNFKDVMQESPSEYIKRVSV